MRKHCGMSRSPCCPYTTLSKLKSTSASARVVAPVVAAPANTWSGQSTRLPCAVLSLTDDGKWQMHTHQDLANMCVVHLSAEANSMPALALSTP